MSWKKLVDSIKTPEKEYRRVDWPKDHWKRILKKEWPFSHWETYDEDKDIIYNNQWYPKWASKLLLETTGINRLLGIPVILLFHIPILVSAVLLKFYIVLQFALFFIAPFTRN